MPFPFKYICDLLQKLEDEAKCKRQRSDQTKDSIGEWFCEHRTLINRHDTDASAFLSTLLPEKRTDRVYAIQKNRLESIVGKALCLGSTRLKQLREHETPGLSKDLADCVENVLKQSPNPKQKDEVTVEEIDDTLHRIAAASRFSSAAVKASRGIAIQKTGSSDLDYFFTRLSPRDAKWFTRLVLKDFSLAALDAKIVCKHYDPRLPQALAVRDDFAAAVSVLKGNDQTSEPGDLIKIGVKVGRQPWLQARSIKHCADLIDQRRISCEQKIDGEYCQIHIDLTKHRLQEIQIFSKSGKDSTKDRTGLHRAIRESLKLGQKDCPLKRTCILEGELVVYSDRERKILPFHKIRKHVTRSGSFLGTAVDSQAHDYEHLMIVYYDVLMLDEASLLGTKQSERFRRLKALITPRSGHAELVRRQVIDFRKAGARECLKEAFAKCIIAREEGLVLKPDDPYFNFDCQSRPHASCAIKLKKEYLKDFGDVGDFAVIGGSYNAVSAKKSRIDNLKYTHFFVACLDNPGEAQAKTDTSKYVVTNVVTLSDMQLGYFKTYCNPASVPMSENTYMRLDFRGLGSADRPTDIFPDPPIFDVYCFSFDRAPNARIWTMRFPQVSKIHLDRSHLDVISFEKLQNAALDAIETPEMEDSQEMRIWLSKIEKADPQNKGKVLEYDSEATVSDVSTESEFSTISRTSSATPGSKTTSVKMQQFALSQIASDHPAVRNSLCTGLITPPISSANKGSASRSITKSTVRDSRSSSRKRSTLPSEGSTPKRLKHSSQHTKPASQVRQPLTARDANDSQRTAWSRSSASPPPTTGELETAPPAEEHSSVHGSFQTADEPPSSPTCRGPRRTNDFQEVVQIDLTEEHSIQVPGKCCYIRQRAKCAFENCSVLLAPCISKYAWIQDLLNGHGIADYTIDPVTWTAQSVIPPSLATDGQHSGTITKSRRVRRICLVEIRRPGATTDFMNRIAAAGLERQNGQREWISVYDWRILEDITSLESGAPINGPDPWRTRYMGIA